MLTILQVASEDPALWAWVKLIGGIALAPGTLLFLFTAWKAWQRGELAKFMYTQIGAFKQNRADAGKAEDAKVLTTIIKFGMDNMPGLKKEHERLLQASGANAASVLGPAIAAAARPPHGVGDA